jgi:hypothetical protein
MGRENPHVRVLATYTFMAKFVVILLKKMAIIKP